MASLNLSEPVASDENRRFPSTPADREAVRQQLERILAHPSFKHSKRYPKLLRYVVVRTLAGDGHLKERTLGTEVFGRHPDYDTNEDPVVRITAGEIRKRIAQYYHEPGHEAELRIDLPAGSYMPELHPAADKPAVAENGDRVAASVAGAELDLGRRGLFTRRPVIYALVVILAVAAVVGTTRVRAWVSPKPLDDFWSPVMDLPGTTLVVIGEPIAARPRLGQPAEFSVKDHIYSADHIAFSDANALFRLAQIFGSHGKAARLQTATTTTLTDLRQGPVVLVAGLDNEWTMRLAQSLRYRFGITPDHFVAWIEDRDNPARRDWSVDFSEKYSQMTQDYAIVSRFSDPTTGQPVVIAAGMGENGTIAAGEFLTDAREMEDATRQAPRNWQTENVEFVIATQVINEKSARPRVVATCYW
jgi:hypothetical protein